MEPNPSKVQALQELLKPNNHPKHQLFLGLINYLQPFIPILANKASFLFEQLAEWDWNPSTDAVFQCSRS